MGWKLIGRPKMVAVTQHLAIKFKDMDPAPGDRPLSERRLMVYEQAYRKGELRPVSWATAYCVETGGTYRVNGKHMSTMLSGQEELEGIYAVWEEYQCDTLEDLAHLYATFDSKTQSRTSSDINYMFAQSVKELRDVPRKVVSLAVGGMAYSLWEDATWRKSLPERAELLLEYPEFVIWLQDIVGRRNDKPIGSQRLRRNPVAAAMFSTWVIDREGAVRFWEAVRDEEGDLEDPPRVLSRWLTWAKVPGPSSRITNTGAVSHRAMYVNCLKQWNCWRRGVKGQNPRYKPGESTPKVL